MSADPGTEPASTAEARVIIDHVSGSRRGKRQVFPLGARVRFGRHPENEVAFHARRDLDASSRHAELANRRAGSEAHRAASDAERAGSDADRAGSDADRAGSDAGGGYVLRDTGSSNGTLVDGRPLSEIAIPRETPITVTFGPGGPAVRIFIGVTAPAPVRGSLLRQLWERACDAPRAWPIWVALALGLATLVAWVSLV
jgi:hypothetical protein